MQRMTNRREGHLHHGRGGNITLKLAAASFISLYAPPSAAEIQINDKSASAFQPSSPYFIPLSQYSIPPPSFPTLEINRKDYLAFFFAYFSSVRTLEFPSTNSFTSSERKRSREDSEKSQLRSSLFSRKRYYEYIPFFLFSSISNLST